MQAPRSVTERSTRGFLGASGRNAMAQAATITANARTATTRCNFPIHRRPSVMEHANGRQAAASGQEAAELFARLLLRRGLAGVLKGVGSAPVRRASR